MKVIAGIFFLSVVLYGCYYDSEEYLFPEITATCDTSQVSYAASVAPILDQYCLGCHSNAMASGNVNLEIWADVKIYADNGSLLGSITHQGGYSPMPKGSGKLEDCPIAVIQKWIEMGAPNN